MTQEQIPPDLPFSKGGTRTRGENRQSGKRRGAENERAVIRRAGSRPQHASGEVALEELPPWRTREPGFVDPLPLQRPSHVVVIELRYEDRDVYHRRVEDE